MKKLIRFTPFFLALTLVILLTRISLVTALTPDSAVMPLRETSLLGENNYYSVFFRGNGEAVVSFKAQYTNTGDSPISTVKYIIPESISINNVIAFQVIKNVYNPCYPPVYRQPLPLGSDNQDGSEGLSSTAAPFNLDEVSGSRTPAISVTPEPDIDNNGKSDSRIIMPCMEGQNYYGGYGDSYQKAEYQITGEILMITLPKHIQPNASVNYVISYRTPDYAMKDLLGEYNYEFVSLQSEQSIESMQVGIATEQDHILKDAGGKVNYSVGASSALIPPSADSASGSYNQELHSYYNRIGQGSVYKYASHLSPLESYTVKGAYADCVCKLYGKQIIIGLLSFLVFIGISVLIIKRTLHFSKDKTEKISGDKNTLHPKLLTLHKEFLISIGFSLLGSTCAVVYTIFLYFFMTNILPNFSAGYGLEPIFMMLMLVISFGVYATFLFIPALVISIKSSISWGIATFVFTLMWLLFYLAVISVFIFIFFGRNPVYPLSSSGYMRGFEQSEAIKPSSN